MTYGTFNNRKIIFKASDDFDIIDMNRDGYIVRLANNLTGAVINVSVGKYSGESLKELKNNTENNLERNGLRIVSSNIKNKFKKQTIAINYIQKNQGVNVLRKSLGFVIGSDYYTFEYVTVEGQSTSKDEEAYRIAIESFEVKKSYF